MRQSPATPRSPCEIGLRGEGAKQIVVWTDDLLRNSPLTPLRHSQSQRIGLASLQDYQYPAYIPRERSLSASRSLLGCNTFLNRAERPPSGQITMTGPYIPYGQEVAQTTMRLSYCPMPGKGVVNR